MKIEIKDFCALKRVEFEINPGISIIAGKNGCGKSQLLMALAHQYGNQTLKNPVYYDIHTKNVTINDKPNKALYRPAVRQYGAPSSTMFTAINPPNYLQRNDPNWGYTSQIEGRFTSLHNDLTRLYVSHGMSQNEQNRDMSGWKRIHESFYKVFNKRIDGIFDETQGGRVGLVLDNERITPFHSLSTGELEFLSLVKDLVTENEVDLFLIDEIDAHFHPDLQNKIIDVIWDIIGDRYLLITTHSPSLMLSVEPANLYYLQKFDEITRGQNQIVRLADDLDVMQKISELYVGFVSDVRFSSFISNTKNQEVYNFISECLRPSQVLEDGVTGQSEPQNSSLRAVILGIGSNTNIIDYGCGKGRLLSAFDAIDDRTLGYISYVGYDIDEANISDFQSVVEKYRLNSRFREEAKHLLTLGNQTFDICLMANVLHEIGPDKIANSFNTLFGISNPMAKIIIFEALELYEGEENYVVFDGDSIKALLSRLEQEGKVSTSDSHPSSFNGRPLLEMHVTILAEDCTICNEDVIRALDVTIKNSANKLSEHVSGTELKSKQYAFYCHNIAHAEAYKAILAKQE